MAAYIIDETRFRKNLSLIKHVADNSGVEIIVAFKAFAMWGVFDIYREYFSGAAASSINEARLCFEELSVPAHSYSPAYKESDFNQMLKYSSHITFNSLSQYYKFADRVIENGTVSAGLRINPEFSETNQDIYNPCTKGSRLGITANQLPEKLPAGIEGFHFHVLFESDSYTLERVLKVVEAKFGKYFNQIKWINMGGGHLITGKNYDIEHAINILTEFRKRTGLHIILEPGSAFAWETGELFATVEDIVENDGIRTAILDVSFTAHMPDCLEMPYMPRVAGAIVVNEDNSKIATDSDYIYRLGGNSCLSGDFMGYWQFDHELVCGEQISFWDMIHYTMVKTTTFNGVDHPDIGIRTLDGNYKIIKQFDYNDYKMRLS